MSYFTLSELKCMPDERIVDLLIQDNGQVVSYFFYQKCGGMLGYIVKEVFSYRVERDELVNELYIYLKSDDWRKLREFEGRSKLTTWLSVVAVRFFVKKRDRMIDSGRKETLCLEQVQEFAEPRVRENFISNMDLYSAIGRLRNGRDRYVILSLEIEGKEPKEVAAELGVTVDNLYNISKRAKAKLSRLLKAYEYGN